eukprot:TRINITY_DN988_c1_g1_i1.p1 TRINITY_DN988_c1_g1~~TRINITY_DN988_c1_g1_i1.p1  ORF type:complete len:135 (-),score=22.14 TRINITY_DN988_c1_g1_i1:33-437(-)
MNIAEKPKDRQEKLKVLKEGYTPAKRRFEIGTITIFSILSILNIYNIYKYGGFESIILNLICCFVGIVMADFLSGVVHWFFDTYASVNTPVIGTIVRSFREHHLYPKAMCEHDFIEVNNDKSLFEYLLVLIQNI